jgi:hypothetical protein
MFKKSKKLKTEFPKYSDLRDVVTQTSLSVDVDTLKTVFRNALPEIGRQLSKNNYNHASLTKAAGIAAAVTEKLQDVTPMYGDLRSFLAKELGFGQEQWTTNSACYGRLDLEDLFDNNNIDVELHVVVTRKPISKEDAYKKYGVK